jgi:two-component system, OmpR family, KDP operon response regulator KdpE
MNKMKVLIADDSEKLLGALRLQLEARGFEVITCTDAYSALSQARIHKPDAMILDIRMPAGEGFSVLERMAKVQEIRDIPVIYITGDRSAELTLRAKVLGAYALIHKPVVMSTLLGTLHSALHQGVES